jgi:hypothetical protein
MNVDSGKNIGSCSVVSGLTMMIVAVLLFSLFLSSVKYHSSSVSALRLIGERFFANGTGTAYFDDGTTASFRHTITSAAGYYYDNSTVFAVGEIPGFDVNDTITLGITGDIITVTILYGAELLGNNSIQPSSIINAKVGDVVTFKNEDWQSYSIRSPPDTYGSEAVPEGANFEFSLAPGQSASILISKPIGMHYELVGEDIKGAVIAEER